MSNEWLLQLDCSQFLGTRWIISSVIIQWIQKRDVQVKINRRSCESQMQLWDDIQCDIFGYVNWASFGGGIIRTIQNDLKELCSKIWFFVIEKILLIFFRIIRKTLRNSKCCSVCYKRSVELPALVICSVSDITHKCVDSFKLIQKTTQKVLNFTVPTILWQTLAILIEWCAAFRTFSRHCRRWTQLVSETSEIQRNLSQNKNAQDFFLPTFRWRWFWMWYVCVYVLFRLQVFLEILFNKKHIAHFVCFKNIVFRDIKTPFLWHRIF